MRKFFTLFVLSALSFIPLSVMAEVLFDCNFNDSTLGRLSKGVWSSGTLASDNAWYTYGSPSTYRQVVAQQLTYSGYCSTVSGRAVSSLSGQQRDYILFPAAKQHAGISAGEKYYMSFLYKVTELNTSSAAQAGTNTYISGLLTANNQTGIAYTQGQVFIKTIDANTYYLGIRKRGDDTQYASTVLNKNTTYLIVVEYEVVSGATNDVVRLYINPSKESKVVAASDCPSSADAAGIIGVGILGISNAPTSAIVDELKVTTSWDDLWEGATPPPTPVVPVPVPAASDKTISSATISWPAAEGADSYVLQWKINGGSYSSDVEIDKDVRSYSMTGLESETKYYVRVKTIIDEDASDWAEINFTTLAEDATMEYKGITFDKYSATNAMPTSGTVYLTHNIVDYTDVTLTGNLTLNLHGKQIYMYGTHIIVPSGKTLTIYDDAGNGVITGGFAGDFMDKGLISVDNGGTLIIGEGAVVNTSDNANDYNAAIDNGSGGTVKISGAPTISGVKTDIYLNSNAITIESGKPLTNTTPYKVFRLTGEFTSGWANMGDEKPSDYFVTSSSTIGVCLGASGEGQIVSAFSLSESSNNSDIATYSGKLSNISFTRSLTSSQYNTFCLPFALNNAQLEEIFGAGYDLREFESSSLDGEVLSLTFSDPLDALEAGKPYLLKPSVNVTNPSFEGVTISATSPADQTSDTYISFHGTYAPTELTGGNRNLLFLGAGNELFWPESTGNIKGFRAYFEVKGGAQGAKRARIVKKEDAATGMDQINDKLPMTNKILRNGQLLILRDNKTYNVLGMEYK